MEDVRIAAVIFRSRLGEIDYNLEKTIKWVDRAKKGGASIVCFPEMNISGYTSHPEVEKTVVTIPSRITKILSKESVKHEICILAGICEKNEDGHLFATHLILKPDGSIGVYRKIHMAPPEQNVFTPGRKAPLFLTDDVKFGVQLCYDGHFPQLSTHMAVSGADLIFMPHASPRGTPDGKYQSWLRHLPARAYDNGLFIVALNQTGSNNNGLTFPGLVMVIGPSGKVINKTFSLKDDIVIFDLKRKEMDDIRNHKMRYFLPNYRPEIYGTGTI